jgi:hypothetical protein
MKTAAMTAVRPAPPKLAFFQTEVLGLARDCDRMAATCPPAERNFHRQRVIDLWSLFGCFCKSPSDVASVMPSLSTTLGKALEDKRYPKLVVSDRKQDSGKSKTVSLTPSFSLDRRLSVMAFVR